MTHLLGVFDPTLWMIPFVIPAIVYIVAKDRGWRKGWREAHVRAVREANAANKIATH